MNLLRLLAEVGCPAESAEHIEVNGLTLDSRRVIPGTVFVAIQGSQSHGMVHVDQALSFGAAAVLYDQWDQAVPAGIPCIRVPELRTHLGALAHAFYENPCKSMAMLGVTGTNGKTTVVHLIGELTRALGIHAGRIGTLGVFVGVEQLQESDRTTPDAIRLAECLHELKTRDVSLTAMEVSSHALDQGRVTGVPFKVAVFTNLTRDHLDYHGSMEAYGQAKARLFKEFPIASAVIDIDDACGRQLAAELNGCDVWTVGADVNARIQVVDLQPVAQGTQMKVRVDEEEHVLSVPLLGGFNAKNALYAVTALSLAEDLPWISVANALGQVKAAPGRMELFRTAGQPTVVVDYAHTPDALENALLTARDHTEGALWVVFGCGGDRDRGKRPLMGEVADRLADRIVLTADNPRSEDPEAIIADIRAGIADASKTTLEPNRTRAIQHAVREASPVDLIVLAGKGHERTQVMADRTLPHSDRAVMAELYGLLHAGGAHVA